VSRGRVKLTLTAQPINEHGEIGYDATVDPPTLKDVEFEGVTADDLLESVALSEWLNARKPGEAWDLTLEIA
jgi:hypothetical protein